MASPDEGGWQTTEKKRKTVKAATQGSGRNGQRRNYSTNGPRTGMNGHPRAPRGGRSGDRGGNPARFQSSRKPKPQGKGLSSETSKSHLTSVGTVDAPVNAMQVNSPPAAAKNSWANVVKTKAALETKVQPVKAPEKPKPSVEKVEVEPKAKNKFKKPSAPMPTPVNEIEAELEKKEAVVEKPKPKEPLVKPGVKLPKSVENKARNKNVSVEFGSSTPVRVSLETIVADTGKEVVRKGTTAELNEERSKAREFQQDSERKSSEISRLQKELDTSLANVSELESQMNDLMSEVSQKKQLEEEVVALKSQIETLESQPPPKPAPQAQGPGAGQRGYYNPNASPKESGQSGQPPKSAAQNHQGQFPPPQVYGPPMGYYHNYYSPYPAPPPNFSSPPRNYYEGHPPQPQPGSNEYGHGEEYRGSNTPPVNVNQGPQHQHSSGNAGMRRRDDKGPPPGYNVGQQQGQFYPYIYQGQMGYQQQQQPQNQSRAPQGWSRQ